MFYSFYSIIISFNACVSEVIDVPMLAGLLRKSNLNTISSESTWACFYIEKNSPFKSRECTCKIYYDELILPIIIHLNNYEIMLFERSF